MPIDTAKSRETKISQAGVDPTQDGVSTIRHITPTPDRNVNSVIIVEENSSARDEFVQDKVLIDLYRIDPSVKIYLKKYGRENSLTQDGLSIVFEDAKKNSSTEYVFKGHFSGKNSGEGIEKISISGLVSAGGKFRADVDVTVDLNKEVNGSITPYKSDFEQVKKAFDAGLKAIDREKSYQIVNPSSDKPRASTSPVSLPVQISSSSVQNKASGMVV